MNIFQSCILHVLIHIQSNAGIHSISKVWQIFRTAVHSTDCFTVWCWWSWPLCWSCICGFVFYVLHCIALFSPNFICNPWHSSFYFSEWSSSKSQLFCLSFISTVASVIPLLAEVWLVSDEVSAPKWQTAEMYWYFFVLFSGLSFICVLIFFVCNVLFGGFIFSNLNYLENCPQNPPKSARSLDCARSRPGSPLCR